VNTAPMLAIAGILEEMGELPTQLAHEQMKPAL
jgi:hypothetical protein